MAASLCPGLLQKLLQEMAPSDDEIAPRSADPPALLQVTSIVPAMGGGDGLFPDRGFYLKVSDSSHAIYAALPQEQDDLILGDEIQLGQFIHVERLEPASPVPVLRGVRPLPGRHPCVGDPSDLVAASAAGEPLASRPAGFLPLGRGTPAGPPLPEGRKKPRSVSASRRGGDGWRNTRKEKHYSSRSIPTSPEKGLSRRHTVDAGTSEILKELAKISVACVHEDSDDSDSSRSSASSSVSVARTLRRSWDSTARSKDRRRDLVPIPRRQVGQNKFAKSATRLLKDYSSDHQLTGKWDTGQALRNPRISRQQKLCVSTKIFKESSCSSCSFGSVDDGKRAENGALPASLPSNLLKIGKEVLRHRDLALLTAVEALQEASASERLIQCLSSYPELQSSKADDPQGLVDRFLNFLEDLRQARLVAQSLAKVTPRTANSDLISSLSTKDAIKVATQSRHHAVTWIKAAMESDSSPPATLMKPIVDSIADTTDGKPPSLLAYSRIVPFACKQRLNYDTWLKGTAPLAAADLANTLQSECNRWFLSYIEKFLDGVLGDTIDTASENQIAGLLFQIKKVDEWLEGIACRETSSSKDSHKENLADSEEIEACQRVRRKIYGILLKHVDRAASALENVSATDEGSASEGQEQIPLGSIILNL